MVVVKGPCAKEGGLFLSKLLQVIFLVGLSRFLLLFRSLLQHQLDLFVALLQLLVLEVVLVDSFHHRRLNAC